MVFTLVVLLVLGAVVAGWGWRRRIADVVTFSVVLVRSRGDCASMLGARIGVMCDLRDVVAVVLAWNRRGRHRWWIEDRRIGDRWVGGSGGGWWVGGRGGRVRGPGITGGGATGIGNDLGGGFLGHTRGGDGEAPERYRSNDGPGNLHA